MMKKIVFLIVCVGSKSRGYIPRPFRAGLLILVFGFTLWTVWAQNNTTASVPNMDSAVKILAGDINRKLTQAGAQKITVGRFVYNGYIPPLSNYWVNQLTDELVNISGRSYGILPDGSGAADWTISGEIIGIGNIIRVYTRLVRTGNQTVEGVFHTDLERNQHLMGMLSPERGDSSSGSIPWDIYEIDSQDNPVVYEAGNDETSPVLTRTLHSGDDNDYFLITATAAGRIVLETTGDTDTYMELLDAGTGETLDENDDGGSNYNARIIYAAEAGRRYLVKIRAYGSGDTGQYGFRSYYRSPAVPDEFEPDDDPSSAGLISVGIPQRHTFHTGDDQDWIRFQITRSGRYIIRARGITSNELDTCIELYDMDENLLDEDDDGGENYDARLSHYFTAGLYRLKIWCYDNDPAEAAYNVSVTAE